MSAYLLSECWKHGSFMESKYCFQMSLLLLTVMCRTMYGIGGQATADIPGVKDTRSFGKFFGAQARPTFSQKEVVAKIAAQAIESCISDDVLPYLASSDLGQDPFFMSVFSPEL